MITYRTLTQKDDFERVIDIEMLVWGISDARSAIDATTLMVLTHVGGHVLGAFDGDTIVGFTIAFPMFGETRMWSHIAAVIPEYQRQGIGQDLKHQQREWAKNRGYTSMSWSFDPVMAANAHFNLHILGAKTNTHHGNFYGEMNDSLNIGMPTDRLEMLWIFDEDLPHSTPPDEAPFLLRVDGQYRPEVLAQSESEWVFVEIPKNFIAIRGEDRQQAIDWKLAVREVLQSAFERGYWAVDFLRKEDRNWYALHKE